jgi:hypothetical protein
MARHIYLTKNPDNEPEMIEPAKNDSIIYIKSQGWTKNHPPPEFEIEFEPEFDGKWNTTGSDSDKPVGTTGKAGRTWKSKPYNPKPKEYYQRVKIKLKSSVTHPDEGYKYTIRMGTEELDPRVVPL